MGLEFEAYRTELTSKNIFLVSGFTGQTCGLLRVMPGFGGNVFGPVLEAATDLSRICPRTRLSPQNAHRVFDDEPLSVILGHLDLSDPEVRLTIRSVSKQFRTVMYSVLFEGGSRYPPFFCDPKNYLPMLYPQGLRSVLRRDMGSKSLPSSQVSDIKAMLKKNQHLIYWAEFSGHLKGFLARHGADWIPEATLEVLETSRKFDLTVKNAVFTFFCIVSGILLLPSIYFQRAWPMLLPGVCGLMANLGMMGKKRMLLGVESSRPHRYYTNIFHYGEWRVFILMLLLPILVYHVNAFLWQ